MLQRFRQQPAALERTVFELELQHGTTLAYRLDPKPGADPTLVLHTPPRETTPEVEVLWRTF